LKAPAFEGIPNVRVGPIGMLLTLIMHARRRP
jgi:hypothetical protein